MTSYSSHNGTTIGLIIVAICDSNRNLKDNFQESLLIALSKINPRLEARMMGDFNSRISQREK